MSNLLNSVVYFKFSSLWKHFNFGENALPGRTQPTYLAPKGYPSGILNVVFLDYCELLTTVQSILKLSVLFGNPIYANFIQFPPCKNLPGQNISPGGDSDHQFSDILLGGVKY